MIPSWEEGIPQMVESIKGLQNLLSCANQLEGLGDSATDSSEPDNEVSQMTQEFDYYFQLQPDSLFDITKLSRLFVFVQKFVADCPPETQTVHQRQGYTLIARLCRNLLTQALPDEPVLDVCFGLVAKEIFTHLCTTGRSSFKELLIAPFVEDVRIFNKLVRLDSHLLVALLKKCPDDLSKPREDLLENTTNLTPSSEYLENLLEENRLRADCLIFNENDCRVRDLYLQQTCSVLRQTQKS